MNMKYVSDFDGLVLDVVLHFGQLMDRFNKEIKARELKSKMLAINNNLVSLV